MPYWNHQQTKVVSHHTNSTQGYACQSAFWRGVHTILPLIILYYCLSHPKLSPDWTDETVGCLTEVTSNWACLGMCNNKKCMAIIHCLKNNILYPKHCDTGTLQYISTLITYKLLFQKSSYVNHLQCTSKFCKWVKTVTVKSISWTQLLNEPADTWPDNKWTLHLTTSYTKTVNKSEESMLNWNMYPHFYK